MYKYIASLLFITLLGSSTTLYAEPLKPESLDQLIQLSNVKELLQGSAIEIRPLFEKQAESIIKQKLSVKELNSKQQQAAQQISELMLSQTQQVMKNPKFIQMIKDTYQKTYSEEEAQAYIAFLNSPIGQSILKKSSVMLGTITQQSIQLTTNILKEPAQQQEMVHQLNKILQPLLIEEQKKKK